jgi:hypothetical protein
MPVLSIPNDVLVTGREDESIYIETPLPAIRTCAYGDRYRYQRLVECGTCLALDSWCLQGIRSGILDGLVEFRKLGWVKGNK